MGHIADGAPKLPQVQDQSGWVPDPSHPARPSLLDVVARASQETHARTWDEAESAAMERALESLETAASWMNECIRKSEEREKLRELQLKFVGADILGSNTQHGISTRALVMEGELVQITSRGSHRTYYFHLFNDALIYSRPTANQGFKFHGAVMVNGSSSVENVERAPVNSKAYTQYGTRGSGENGIPINQMMPNELFKRVRSQVLDQGGEGQGGCGGAGPARSGGPVAHVSHPHRGEGLHGVHPHFGAQVQVDQGLCGHDRERGLASGCVREAHHCSHVHVRGFVETGEQCG